MFIARMDFCARFILTSVLLIAVSTSMLVMTSSAKAQVQARDVLPTTVVLGRQIEEKLSAELAEYGHQVYVIQGEDMLKQGYTDLNEALAKMAPGLAILVTGRGNTDYFYLNGNNHVLWLIDGIRLNSRLFGSADVDTIGIHMVERVEVLIGGEGLFYGTEASSGVVNVITKKPTEEFSGEAGAFAGTKGYYDVFARVSGSAGRHRFLASASYDAMRGYIPFDLRAFELNNNQDPRVRGYDRLNASLKYDTELYLDSHNSLSVALMRYQGNFDNAHPLYAQSTNHRIEDVGMLKWDHDVSPNYSYYLKTYYHSRWSKVDQYYVWPYSLFFPANDKALFGFQDWGFNFMNSIRSYSGHELLIGYDYQNYWGRDDTLFHIDPIHEDVHAVFFQFRPYFQFWEGWKLALGARYNHTDGGNSFIWNVSTKMPVIADDKLSVRANIGTSFILPTAEQLFLNDPINFAFGNPDLEAERSFSATVGVLSHSEMLDFDIGLFYERVTNKIGMDSQFVYQNVPGRTEIKGGSVSAILRPAEGLALSASFTAQAAETVNADGTRDNRLLAMPKEYLKLGLQYDGDAGNGQKYGIGVYGTWMGRIYTNNAPAGYPGAPYYNFGDYWLVDVNMYCKPVENVRVTLSLANVFNTKYAPYGTSFLNDSGNVKPFNYPNGAPFTVTMGMTYSF
ncbi:MAG: TonB-dependent receptor [Deltaproteobacteria bacterium]|jgi:vitamin B12 transporter|nr:TonB-dependent receptor [Deltaproteobacteria bacterium]